AAGDGRRLVELAGRPEALAQPPGFADAFRKQPAVPAERRGAVLAAPPPARPGPPSPLLAPGHSHPANPPGRTTGQGRGVQAAAAAHPRNSAAHYNLGLALRNKGDLTGAIAAYRKAIDLAPNFAPAHNNLGTALRAKGDLNGAIAEFQQAIRLDPKLARAHD